MTKTPDGFWDWSSRHYALDGVEQKLIKLQDEFGLNVNILLWCAWSATAYDEISDLVLRKAIDLTEHWRRDVTGALRTSRRRLSSPPPQVDKTAAYALREKIKAAELDAEKIEQEMLETLARNNLTGIAEPDAQRRARRNIARYVTLSGCVKSSRFSTALLEEMIGLILAPRRLPAARPKTLEAQNP